MNDVLLRWIPLSVKSERGWGRWGVCSLEERGWTEYLRDLWNVRVKEVKRKMII